jgi:hypothetical protein
VSINHGSAPHLAAEEQQRGDNLAQFIDNFASDSSTAAHDSLPLYQAAVQDAYSNAAKYGEQPDGGWRS